MKYLNRRRLITGTALGLASLAGATFLARRYGGSGSNSLSTSSDYDQPVVPVIDAHCHISQAMHSEFRSTMDRNQVRFSISHGYWKGIDYDVATVSEIRTQYSDRYAAFYAPMWGSTDPHYLKSKEPVTVTDQFLLATLPEELQRFMKAGGASALGLKLWRDIGARVHDEHGHILQLTDPRFAPVLKTAEALGAIVSIHSCGTCQTLRDSLVARYPGIQFVYCHWGSSAGKLAELRKLLNRFPNVVLDTSPASGWPTSKGYRQQEVHDFYVEFQDRLLLGTDFVETERTECCDDLWWSCLYKSFWRYHQTSDLDFQLDDCNLGRWTGVGLSSDILKKIYWSNAYRFFRLDRVMPNLDLASGNDATVERRSSVG